MEPTAETSTPPASPAKPARRHTGAFRCYPGSSKGRIQGILGAHFPLLWGSITAKWLPTARPIDPSQMERNGIAGYERGTLSDLLISLGESAIEWDGFEVCRHLHETYGWRADFHLAALIHAWSRDLADKLRS